jgi:hypothetical protein
MLTGMSARKVGSGSWRKGVEAYVRSVRASAPLAREPAAEGPCYVVPRSDVALFTLGTQPRDRDQTAALEQRIAAEAEGLAAPLGKPVRLRWL